jgi:uncharacterized Tic20 family protein
MADDDHATPEPSKGAEPGSLAQKESKLVSELDLSFGGGRKGASHAATRGISAAAPRALLERWRLTPSGCVVDTEAGDLDKVAAAAMHLWPLYTAVIGPLSIGVPFVLWLAFRRRSPLVRDHGLEVLSAQATMVILLVFVCVGWVALIPWLPVWIVSLVRGAVAAGGGELFRYPAVLRFGR